MPILDGAHTASGRIFLSFDDGPDPEWTPRILDVLAAAEVRATFFMIGCRARMAPALVRRIVAAGHEVGNHTLSHRHPWCLSRKAAEREVREGGAVLAELCGQAPRWFRPPHGRLRRCMIETAASEGQQLALWTVSAVDWGPLGNAARITQRLARVHADDIVLMHDGRNVHNRPDELLGSLPSFLAQLRRQALQPSVLSERQTNIVRPCG